MTASRTPKASRYVLASLCLAFASIALFYWIWVASSENVLPRGLVAPQILAFIGSVTYCYIWFAKIRGRRMYAGAALFGALLAGPSTVLYCLEIAERFRYIRYFNWENDWHLFIAIPAIEGLFAAFVGAAVGLASNIVNKRSITNNLSA